MGRDHDLVEQGRAARAERVVPGDEDLGAGAGGSAALDQQPIADQRRGAGARHRDLDHRHVIRFVQDPYPGRRRQDQMGPAHVDAGRRSDDLGERRIPAPVERRGVDEAHPIAGIRVDPMTVLADGDGPAGAAAEGNAPDFGRQVRIADVDEGDPVTGEEIARAEPESVSVPGHPDDLPRELDLAARRHLGLAGGEKPEQAILLRRDRHDAAVRKGVGEDLVHAEDDEAEIPLPRR